MTTSDLPVCPCCEQEFLRRFRFRGLDPEYLACLECDAVWESASRPIGESQQFDFGALCSQHDLSYPDDVFWIDLPREVGQVIRRVGQPSVVGVITGLAERDGRAYDVEFIDEYGTPTYAGRMRSDGFYVAGSDVWERRYLERRARAANRPTGQTG